MPADGQRKVYVYKHEQKTGSLTGVSAIPTKVMESKKNLDWTRNKPVEHRPYIRKIDGVTRFFWLTTVVTIKQGGSGDQFIAGSVPDVVLTDAAHNAPIWVNPLKPEGWEDELRTALTPIWSRD